MTIIEKLNKSEGKTLFSFEILPPLKGDTINSVYENVDPLMEFDPAYINVTYHREEIVLKPAGNGLLRKKIIRKRPGTIGLCAAISARYKVETVPHLLCGGFSREDTENALIELDFLGIRNVLALRGDSVKGQRHFMPEPYGNAFAVDLVKQITDLNNGIYIDEELENKHATNFCVGVAGYPEKHFEAPSLNIDIQNLKAKVDAGADYVVTQMFFDNASYFSYVEKCRDAGINVPIIPGIKPFASKRQLSILPTMFHVDLPDALALEVLKSKSNESVRQIGIEWAIEQGRELLAAGVPALHFYSMGRSENIRNIAAQLF
ncbi:MAG: methylenetetrahydrofolate reductase [NAD(P)H] [Flavobacteriales bacterium]|nr:MAG: methylenetetrahydrofolate reductase [NAD(P)H] [Flavobacteriales bacterium]